MMASSGLFSTPSPVYYLFSWIFWLFFLLLRLIFALSQYITTIIFYLAFFRLIFQIFLFTHKVCRWIAEQHKSLHPSLHRPPSLVSTSSSIILNGTPPPSPSSPPPPPLSSPPSSSPTPYSFTWDHDPVVVLED